MILFAQSFRIPKKAESVSANRTKNLSKAVAGTSIYSNKQTMSSLKEACFIKFIPLDETVMQTRLAGLCASGQRQNSAALRSPQSWGLRHESNLCLDSASIEETLYHAKEKR